MKKRALSLQAAYGLATGSLKLVAKQTDSPLSVEQSSPSDISPSPIPTAREGDDLAAQALKQATISNSATM